MIELGTYDVLLVIAGVAVLSATIVPKLLADRFLSFPLVWLVIGMGLFALPLGLELPDPREDTVLFERVSELAVIISLMGAGLKIDRPLGWRSWSTTWRLLAVAMPLTIVATYLLGGWVGLVPATAMLLAASMAPTDPVLAAEVQVRGVYQQHEDELRFGLTSEAGLNDGLAFPFTNLAILFALVGTAPSAWLGEWLAIEVGYKIAVGVVAGWVLGRLTADLVFAMERRERLLDPSGFVALASTLLTYGLTEVVGGYGFLAVFVAASVIRHHKGSHAYHQRLSAFTEELERVLAALLIILFGGAIDAGILGALTWRTAIAGLLILFVVRPVAGWVALMGTGIDRRRRAGIAFFGIRGMGSIYYFSHGLVVADFPGAETAWALLTFVIAGSVVLHGITATPFTRRLPSERGARS